MSRIQMDKAGFTLVEMLAVIVIMSLLIGIAVTGANKARENVWRTKARDTSRQLVQAWNLYLLDYREFPDEGEFSKSGGGIPATVKNLKALRPDGGGAAKYLELTHEEDDDGDGPGLTDHWKHSIYFNLDFDYDGLLKNPAPEVYKGKEDSYKEVKGAAIAWSMGRDPGRKKRWIVVWQ